MRLTKNEILYLLPLLLISFVKGIGISSDNKVYVAVLLFGTVLIVMKSVKERWTRNEFIGLAALFLIGVLSLLMTKKETVLFSLLLVVGSKGIRLNKIFWTMLISRLVGFFYNVLLSVVGILPAKQAIFYREGVFISRYSFGFGHPNLFHSSFFMIVVLWLFLKFERLKLIEVFFLMICNFLIFSYSYSRTGFYMICLLFVGYYALQWKPVLKLLKIVVPYVQFFLLGLTLVLARLLGKSVIVQQLDIFLTGRLYYTHLQFQYPLTLFGRNYDGTGILFDNSYSMIVMLYGVILAIIVSLAYYKTARFTANYGSLATNFVLVMISLLLFTESFYMNTLFNITLFIIAKYYFRELDDLQ
ncbi:hypothetical protein [Streptococcus himalayensis]|uniref:Polysaccharide polymerase n=1 Tax=Streptococcus himalayensis TaxID=1888195 RepID=A0A917A3E6_9STRE|nr:hypothetical protein [Streptococcus himalayensis]GGE24876.1 hypothetical protein GCM10011510_02450 [Streptococcus himalayensis]